MPKFTTAELPVMKVLWEEQGLKPAEILSRLKKPLKDSALRAVLAVLLEKGHVQRQMVGKAYRYSAVTKQTASLRTNLKEMVDVFFNGSTEGLIMNLIKSQKLSDSDLLELKRMATGESSAEEDSSTESSRKKSATKKSSSKKGRNK